MRLLSLCENNSVNIPRASVPPGWYPDPAGLRQWRVWNGTTWSDVTRPYGPLETPTHADSRFDPAELETLGSLRRLTQFGIFAYYTGLALMVSVVSHWPGRSDPLSARFANAAFSVALGLIVIGTLSFATCVRDLRGRWTWDAVLPVVNTFAAAYWMSRRLCFEGFEWRLGADALITFGFVFLNASQPWIGVALAGLAFTQLARAYLVMDRISAAPPPPQHAP